jgi:hypothetical protein
MWAYWLLGGVPESEMHKPGLASGPWSPLPLRVHIPLASQQITPPKGSADVPSMNLPACFRWERSQLARPTLMGHTYAVAARWQVLGAKQMEAENVLVKKPKKGEVMGTVTTICTDKTGTLTTGNMVVKSVIIGGVEFNSLTHMSSALPEDVRAAPVTFSAAPQMYLPC